MSRPNARPRIALVTAFRFACALSACVLSACALRSGPDPETAPISAAQTAELGAAAFYAIANSNPPSKDAEVAAYASCVGGELHRALEDAVRTIGRFEVAVFAVDEAGAFALPGGKVGLYTALLPLSHSQDQLAAVFAHALAHVLAHHARDRLEEIASVQLGRPQRGVVIETFPGESLPEGALTMAALGYGPELEGALPYTFEQESEADVLGLELMARAGFDPRQAVEMWKNLRRAPGAERPEYFRRHAHNERRIHRLYDAMGRAIEIQRTAGDMGRAPDCRAPTRRAIRE